MITVICPVRNEEESIEDVISFFITSEPKDKELLIIDGESNDDTVRIVQKYATKHPNIRILKNPDRFVPYALNRAIADSAGDPVIRLDAHTEYAEDYFLRIMDCFNRTGADIVGGPMRAVGRNQFQSAVAIATSSAFGVGNSAFHNENKEGYTESVYLGAWRRTVFESIGLFDTEMLRNQDDEFHYRANSKGLKVYLDPRIRSWYQPRDSAGKLWKQYFQYGLFKPLVLKKVKGGLRVRHLIPSGLFLYLISLPIAFVLPIWLLPLLAYFALDLIVSVARGASEGFKVIVNMCVVFPILHLAYGAGFIKGKLTLISGKVPKI
jgi:glycosyltransferase involved in cell wall biosynthesis